MLQGEGCKLAVLPENFALMPERGRDKAAHAEQPGEGPIQAFLHERGARTRALDHRRQYPDCVTGSRSRFRRLPRHRR